MENLDQVRKLIDKIAESLVAKAKEEEAKPDTLSRAFTNVDLESVLESCFGAAPTADGVACLHHVVGGVVLVLRDTGRDSNPSASDRLARIEEVVKRAGLYPGCPFDPSNKFKLVRAMWEWALEQTKEFV